MAMQRMAELTSHPELNVDVRLNISCLNNCSGHGECSNGVCICEIKFEGGDCRTLNASYFVGFASVFFTLAFVCLVQLVMCVVAEWHRMKAPSMWGACRVTTQKLLYFVVFLASILRGAYFSSPVSQTDFEDSWSSSLMSAYYPLLLSGSSLIVCFWAEIFHLRDIRWEKSQFLSKTFLAFVSFNLITYSLLIAEFCIIYSSSYSADHKNFYIHVFNGCYAVLLFIVVIFFLIYGVQVFFKVRGGFLLELKDHNRDDPYRQLICSQKNLINTSQLHQSRIGLLSQTLMLSFIIAFLCSETLSGYWKNKVPLHSRNWHDFLFRVVEIGVALWFPCVLWNCMSPEQLWILNPKRILKNLECEIYQLDKYKITRMDTPQGDESAVSLVSSQVVCFVCREPSDRPVMPGIQVCHCSFAHPECLISCVQERYVICYLCGQSYPVVVEEGKLDWRAGCTATFCRHLCVLLLVTAVSAVVTWQVIVNYPSTAVRTLASGSFCLILYICISQLWHDTDKVWKKASSAGLQVYVLSQPKPPEP